MIKPLIVSWDVDDPSDFVRLTQWQGTRDPAAFLSVPATIQFMQAHDWEAVRARSHALASDLRRRLCDWYGVAPLTPDSPAWFAQMFTVLLPPTDPVPLQTRLYEERHIQMAVGAWHDQLQLRLSVQGYNDRDDMDQAFAAITDLLPRP